MVAPLLKQKNALASQSIATGFFTVKSTVALTE
nr:MAG TPA: hypothetical protein [Caudoviricetes sp.]